MYPNGTLGASSPTTGGSGSTTYSMWTDPNYWSGWNNTAGSLGSAVGNWANIFNGNNQQPTYIQPPQSQSNTLMYVFMGLLLVVLVVILFIILRKK